MIVVEGVLGGGAIIFCLLFWVLNEVGSGKNTPNILGGLPKTETKKSKIIMAPPLDKL